MNSDFGNWSIELELYNWLLDNLEPGKTLLEIGSGLATEELIKKWNVISIEENIEWVNKYHQNYIHAPIINGWYNFDIIKKSLTSKIDAILVDGPAHGERLGLVERIEFFINKKPELIIFDDTKRLDDKKCFEDILSFLEQNPEKYKLDVQILETSKGVSCIKIEYK